MTAQGDPTGYGRTASLAADANLATHTQIQHSNTEG